MFKLKNIKLICISMLLGAVMLPSCKKDFLEIVPKGKLIAEKTADYDLLLNSNTFFLMYNAMPSGDELAAIDPYFTNDAFLPDQKAFRRDADLWLAEDVQTEWSILMTSVYAYNKIINEVMDSKEGTDARKKSIRAEALASRAWCYFMMVNHYAKPYNAATAATDLAVPAVLQADVTQTSYTRATVKEIYDLIEKDLTDAIPDLPVKMYNRIRMSRPAGQALLGKMFMFKSEFNKAMPLLNDAIAGLAAADVPLGLYDLKTEFQEGGVYFPMNPLMGPPKPQPTQDKETLYMKNTLNFNTYVLSGFVLTPATVALFTAGDYRKQFQSANPFGDFVNTFPLGMKRVWGGGPQNVGLSLPDLYLLQAECKARLSDLDGAVANLETFRKLRMPEAEAIVPPGIAADRIALTKFILEERIREYPIQGIRWFDMRRLSIDPEFSATVGNSHIVYDMQGNVKTNYPLTPERLCFRVPLYIAQRNTDWPQNP